MSEAKALKKFNYKKFFKENNTIYHNYAKQCAISDTTLWILYSVLEHDEAYTQRELCAEWFFSPQTVNTALKNLEKQEIIKLVPVPGNRKNKQILLTESGEKLAQEIVLPIMQAEQRAFMKMSEDERSMLLAITQKHTSLLKEEISSIR